MVSCKLAKVTTCSTNLTIKIDDEDFLGSNGGVWCWDQQAILDNNRFTAWHEYDSDTLVTDEELTPDLSLEGIISSITSSIESLVTNAVATVAEVSVSDALKEIETTGAAIDAADAAEASAFVADDIAKTTSVSVDSADASSEPELVAKKRTKSKK